MAETSDFSVFGAPVTSSTVSFVPEFVCWSMVEKTVLKYMQAAARDEVIYEIKYERSVEDVSNV